MHKFAIIFLCYIYMQYFTFFIFICDVRIKMKTIARSKQIRKRLQLATQILFIIIIIILCRLYLQHICCWCSSFFSCFGDFTCIGIWCVTKWYASSQQHGCIEFEYIFCVLLAVVLFKCYNVISHKYAALTNEINVEVLNKYFSILK